MKFESDTICNKSDQYYDADQYYDVIKDNCTRVS